MIICFVNKLLYIDTQFSKQSIIEKIQHTQDYLTFLGVRIVEPIHKDPKRGGGRGG